MAGPVPVAAKIWRWQQPAHHYACPIHRSGGIAPLLRPGTRRTVGHKLLAAVIHKAAALHADEALRKQFREAAAAPLETSAVRVGARKALPPAAAAYRHVCSCISLLQSAWQRQRGSCEAHLRLGGLRAGDQASSQYSSQEDRPAERPPLHPALLHSKQAEDHPAGSTKESWTAPCSMGAPRGGGDGGGLGRVHLLHRQLATHSPLPYGWLPRQRSEPWRATPQVCCHVLPPCHSPGADQQSTTV